MFDIILHASNDFVKLNLEISHEKFYDHNKRTNAPGAFPQGALPLNVNNVRKI